MLAPAAAVGGSAANAPTLTGVSSTISPNGSDNRKNNHKEVNPTTIP